MSEMTKITAMLETIDSPAIQSWKERGKKVVGFFCTYFPEEILYAADVLPYRVRPNGCLETSSSDAILSHVNCTFVRSCLQFALEGRYSFLDGVVLSNCCDHVRRLYDVWRERAGPPSFTYLLPVPHKMGDAQIAFFRDTLTKFKEDVESSFEVEITDNSLKNAIRTYNETRDLMHRLYQLRQRENPPISGAETLEVLLASTVMRKDDFNRQLRDLLAALDQREGISNYSARIMIAGGLYDDPEHVRIIEDLGGLVVTDTLCFGSRCFWQSVPISQDPLLDLASAYLTHPSCSRMTDGLHQRNEYMKNMIEKFNVDGVIFQRIRYCDLWGGEMYNVQQQLKKLGIPMLCLEREYALGGTGQLKTRVQAFLELIGS